MSSQQVLTIAQAALHMLLMTAAPILLVVLLVGLIVSILQAVTQINENTLSFIPKLC
jgi:flagellar biosynthetic protein FliQ